MNSLCPRDMCGKESILRYPHWPVHLRSHYIDLQEVSVYDDHFSCHVGSRFQETLDQEIEIADEIISCSANEITISLRPKTLGLRRTFLIASLC